MDNPEKMAGYTRRRGNQRWTIQRKWQHRVHKTKGQPKMDNPDKMAGYTRRRGNQRRTIQRKWQGTQDEGVITDGQSRDNCRVHKTKGQSKMDNPEKMAGYTRRRGKQRWTIHLRLAYPMLPFSLDCLSLIAPSSCVPCSFFWIAHL
jgi:hypothetical protein